MTKYLSVTTAVILAIGLLGGAYLQKHGKLGFLPLP